MQRGIEINIYDLIRHLRKKWPIVLIFMLAAALLANLYGWRQATAAADRERQALEEYALQQGVEAGDLPEHMTAELAELRSELSEQEASFVEAVAKLYMYRMWASDKINAELIVGEPDEGDLEIVQTLYYANEGVESGTNVMTSAEKTYYNVLIKELSGADMSAVTQDISAPGMIQPKWLLIGCVLGALLGCAAVSVLYMMSGKLRIAGDMENPYGVPVLAIVHGEKDMDTDGLTKGLVRLLGDKRTLAIYAVDVPEAREAADRIGETLGKNNICVTMTSDDGFVGKIAEAGAVLFVEQIGKSRYSDIERHVSACRKFSVPAAGCIVVE